MNVTPEQQIVTLPMARVQTQMDRSHAPVTRGILVMERRVQVHIFLIYIFIMFI